MGELSLQFARLPLAGTQEHSIFVYYAAPATPTAEALAELARGG